MACFTWGREHDPLIMVNVPRPFTSGRTPIRVKRLSCSVPSRISVARPAGVRAASADGSDMALDVGDEIDFYQRVARNASGRRDGCADGRHLTPTACIDGVHFGPVVDVVQIYVDFEYFFHRGAGTGQVLLQLVEHVLGMLFHCAFEVCADTRQEEQITVRNGGGE